MFSIWINGILSSLDGYSAHNTDFLALVKVLSTYIWRSLAKCSSSSLYSACRDRGLKQIKKFFFSSKCHVYSLLGQNKGKRQVFFERGKAGWYRVILPKQHIVFYENKKFPLLRNLNNPTHPFAVF